MPIPPLPTPAERFAIVLRWLSHVVASRGVLGLLAAPVVALLLGRVRDINQKFARLAARIAAGTYRPRRAAARRKPAAPNPRRKNPLPQTCGWLLTLVPEAVGYRAQLEHLLREPDTVALLEAAPSAMARVLRPLCWALRLKPPPILAPPRRARPPAPERDAAASRAATPPPSRPRSQSPASPARRRRSAQWPRGGHGPPRTA